ncbi:MAG: superoxide dismutase family protein [Clostridia bacterium]|nr:superoxide dismutase family protein [Clostridia bacterium]
MESNIVSATAVMRGGPLYPNIQGEVVFNQTKFGVEVTADIYGLPPFTRQDNLAISPFGFHIHEGEDCNAGSLENPFPNTLGHYNPYNQPHGNHAGDFPILMPLSNGYAHMSFLTDKFTVEQVLGKALVIHQSPDDYRTQPSGNSGVKIACGIII